MKTTLGLKILSCMAFFLFTTCFIVFANNGKHIIINSINQDSVLAYPIAVKFQSVCCGVPSDVPLQKAIKSFKKRYKINIIDAVHIGPLGREGEYDLAFPLNEMTDTQKKAFIKNILCLKSCLVKRNIFE